MPTIIPKQPTIYPKWTGIVLGVSAFLLVASGLSMLVLWLLTSRTADAIAALDVELGRGQTQEENDLEARVLAYKKKLDDFAKVTEARRYPDNFFPFIQSITHEKAFFTSLSLNPAADKATLAGEAADFRALAEQIAILRATEEVESFTIGSIKLGEEGFVSFSLDLVFPKAFFTIPPPSQKVPEEQPIS
ncbi:MAG: hypothetical protein Q8Q38_01730 [bacterium]|nr:hypothetical protein [bacterium]